MSTGALANNDGFFFFFNQPNNEAMNRDRNSGALKMCYRFKFQYVER